jgi:hypothetical protein
VAVGDFDGDGLGDFAVGAPGDLAGAGTVHVFLGRLGFVPTVTTGAVPTLYAYTAEADLVLQGAAGAGLGRSLAAAGDAFGGGADALLIGSSTGGWLIDVASTLPPAGGPFVEPIGTADGVFLQTPTAGAAVGEVVGAGLLGATGAYTAWVGDAARLHLFRSPPATGTVTETLTVDLSDPSTPDETVTAAIGMDWDADGSPDLVVGCAECAQAGSVKGAVLLFSGGDLLGTADVLASQADATLWGPSVGTRLGRSLAAFSTGRLAIGASGQGNHGGVHVANLDVPLSPTLDAWLVGTNESSTGSAVAVGDLDDDGVEGLIAGGPAAKFGTQRFGMIRAADEVPLTGAIASPWVMQGPGGSNGLGARFGGSLAIGDINGDLFEDVVIGAPRAVNQQQTGLVHVILGGAPGTDPAAEAIPQWMDGDGDGTGGGPTIHRCELVYATTGDDCDDGDPARSPTNLELCATAIDDDCLAANDNVLCGERFATSPFGAPTDLTGSTWCWEDDAWTIGPQGETVSLQDLAMMVHDETLFFDDALDQGMAGATGAASTCVGGSGASVTLAVIGSRTDAQWAVSDYDDVLSDNVVARLRAHGQGYLIGAYALPNGGGTKLVVIGGDYPGVVNGVVDLLRATEFTPTQRGLWENQAVLDWPENERRVHVMDPIGGLAQCHVDGHHVPVDPNQWSSCADGLVGLERIDASLRYHFNRIRSDITLDGPDRDILGWRVDKQTSLAREFTLTLRRRGIEPLPYVQVTPQEVLPIAGVPVDRFEPLGVDRLAMRPVDGLPDPVTLATQRWAMPCDTDDCSESLTTTAGGAVYNRKYAMSLSGTDEGVVYGRNITWKPSAAPSGGAICTAASAFAGCAGAPCWCVEDGATPTADGFILEGSAARGQRGVLVMADRSAPPGTGDPHDAGQYDLWDEDVFRPGRLYVVRARLTLESRGVGEEERVKVEVRPAVLGFQASKVGTTVTLTEDDPTQVLSYVMRAPLQESEIAEDGDYNANPGLLIQQSSDAKFKLGTKVVVSEVAVVELDGLSNGWLPHPDLSPDQPAVVLDETGWDATIDANLTMPAVLDCPAGVTDCFDYETEVQCGTAPKSYADVGYVERFSRAGLAMPAAHLTRLRMDSPTFARASGVVSPIIGAFPRDPCTDCKLRIGLNTDCNVGEVPFVDSVQTREAFDPAVWLSTRGFPSVLRFLAKERADWGGASIKDYLFGEAAGRPYAWDLLQPTLHLNIFDEVRVFNVGLAGWHEGVYRPVSPHQVVRGLFCNLANMVDDEDWTDGLGLGTDVPYYSYCDYFDADGNDCHTDVDTPSLNGTVGCDLSRGGNTATSGVRLNIDTGQVRDGMTWDFRGDWHMGVASLSSRYFTADIDASQLSRPAGSTVSATVAENFDSRVWVYSRDRQELLEGICDVADIAGRFLDHPALDFDYGANVESRNACMMSGTGITQPVMGNGSSGEPESMLGWSALAAGMPDVVTDLVVGQFDVNGLPSEAMLDDPWWGHGASCAWNPEWRWVASVSMATARTDAAASRFCEPGSAWGSGWQDAHAFSTLQLDVERFFPMEETTRTDGKDAVATDGDWHLLAMRPAPAAMVTLPPGSEGKRVRLEVPVAIRPNAPQYIDACSVARAFVDQTFPGQSGGEYTLSGEIAGGLWFANAAGQLADATGAYLPPRTCSTTLAPTPTPPVPVEVRPVMTVAWRSAVAMATMEAVIPAGAMKVGAWIRVPGCTNGDECRPSSGVWSFDVEGSASPGVIPGYAGDDVAFPRSSGFPVSADGQRPRSCDDRNWYLRNAQDVWVDSSAYVTATVDFRQEQQDCLLDFVDNGWMP